jgi:CRP-like cAMP-binding protein
MPTMSEAIRSSIWARSLTPDELARVEATVVERSAAIDEHVCRIGETVDSWVGVIEGLVKLCAVSPEGKSVTLTCVPSGGWFGEGSLLKDQTRKYDAIALRKSRIAFVPRQTFEWLLNGNIGFNRFLLHQINERLGLFIEMIETDRLLDPDTRVARCLAGLFNPYLYPGVQQRLQLSQEETGHLCGLSRQRANQALQVLAKAGILEVEYGQITVLDLDALRGFRR